MPPKKQGLELKIPPPIVTLLIAGVMWAIASATPSLAMPVLLRLFVAGAIALSGVCISIGGVIAFRRASTTINPMKPEKSSTLVTGGIYRFTRNPMYVGLLIVLVAWAVFLSAPLGLAGPLVFVLYISRFQIEPEERVLSTLFGADYSTYKSKVRRWL